MEKLEMKRRVENGKIIIDVPANLEGKEVKIEVSELFNDVKKFHELPVGERLQILERYWATAKYPDVETNKYDVYDQ